MNKKIIRSFFAVLILIAVFLLGGISVNIVSGKQQTPNDPCLQHMNRMWGWTREAAWMSMTTTGKWETDQLFYMLKAGEPIIVTQIGGDGYYLVCKSVGEDWQPLYGWVYKDQILLQSEITPMPE